MNQTVEKSPSWTQQTEETPLLTSKTTDHVTTEETGKRVRKPSRRRRYVILVACWVLQFLSVGVGFGLSVMYVEVIETFDSPRSEAALIQSVYIGIAVGGGIVGGGVLNKFGPGPCIIVGSITTCIGLVTSAFAVNVPMIIIFTGVIGGSGMSVVYLSSFVTVGWIFHDDAGSFLVVLTVGSSLGHFVFPYMCGFLIEEYMWNGTFLIFAGVALHPAICGVIIYHSRFYFKTGSDDKSVRRPFFDSAILKDPVLMLVFFCSLLLALTGNSEAMFLADIMVVRGYSRSVGSLFVALTGLGNFGGRVIGAVLRLNCRVPTIYHWTYFGLLIAVTHVFVIVLTDYWGLLVDVLLYGVGFGVTVSQTAAIVFEACDLEVYPQAVSVSNLVYGSGMFLCGLTGGVIKDTTGSYDLMFYLGVGSSIFVSVATIVMLIILRWTGSRRFSKPDVAVTVEYKPLQEDKEHGTIPITYQSNGSVPRTSAC